MLAGAAALAACATTPPLAGPSGPVGRSAPDDSDLWNLVPPGAMSLADVDVVALRRSPWSGAVVTGSFSEDRQMRQRLFGYDVFNDVDRLVVAGTAQAGAADLSLTVARGRFDPQRVGAAFTAAVPGAAAARWRDSPLWEGAARAVALVTPRTLVDGTPDAVRGAIDAAWGIVPDARGGPLGELRRALNAERPGPAVTVIVVVTDEVRGRAAGMVDVPPGLRRVGARLDLGRDLDVDLLAVLDDGQQAAAAAQTWGLALRELGRQRMLRLLGLAPLIDGASLQVAGARVHGRLHVGEDRRDVLSDRLLFLLQTLAAARGPAASGQP
jgi:hypothetical protein